MIYEQVLAHKTALVLQSPAAWRNSGHDACGERAWRGDLGGGSAAARQSAQLRGIPIAPRVFRLSATVPLSGFRRVWQFPRPVFRRSIGPDHTAKGSRYAFGEPRQCFLVRTVLCRLINLLSQATGCIALSDKFTEFHVVADHNRPLDSTARNPVRYGLRRRNRRGTGVSSVHLAKDAGRGGWSICTTLNRVPRVLTAKEKQFGRRSAYAGTELYLSLVDAELCAVPDGPAATGESRRCVYNRHLPIQMAVGVGPRISAWISAPPLPPSAA